MQLLSHRAILAFFAKSKPPENGRFSKKFAFVEGLNKILGVLKRSKRSFLLIFVGSIETLELG
jgi:hypothetical protein